MRRIRRRMMGSLISTILIVGLTVLSLVMTFRKSLYFNGVSVFCYFTFLSNLLLAVSCLCEVPFYFISLRVSNSKCTFVGSRLPEGTLMPKWVIVVKEVGVTSTTLTMLIALTFLAFNNGIEQMLEGANLFLHLVSPAIAIISFIFFDFGEKIHFKSTPLAVLPMAIYGVVYLYNVITLGEKHGGWKDFYGFNSGILEGNWFVTYPVVLFGTFVLASILFGLHSAGTKVKLKKQNNHTIA